MTRVLILAHGHPELSVGGGEIAAYRHCEELRRRGYDVLFVAFVLEESQRAGTPFALLPGHAQDVLFRSRQFDYFMLSQQNKSAIYDGLRRLIARFRPDIVHFHHYLHLGLEFIREVRNYSAAVPLVVTLHEFIAICHNDGQMIKTDGALCRASSSLDCHRCFPSRAPQDFFLRELFVKAHFDLVDRFVAPSRFLLRRYVDWGIPPERIVVIENGQPEIAGAPEFGDAERLCTTFGFFGQISELKGIFVLLEAIRMLPKKLRRQLRFEINGSLQYQPDEFVARFRAAVAACGDGVRYNGPYRADETARLMKATGWVVVPSIWWENSPLVIQEAFRSSRPVICSDIGGMAEKIRDGETGLHFRAGSPADLAAKFAAAADPAAWRALAGRIEAPPSLAETVQQHLDLYETIRRHRAVRSPTADAVTA